MKSKVKFIDATIKPAHGTKGASRTMKTEIAWGGDADGNMYFPDVSCVSPSSVIFVPTGGTFDIHPHSDQPGNLFPGVGDYRGLANGRPQFVVTPGSGLVVVERFCSGGSCRYGARVLDVSSNVTNVFEYGAQMARWTPSWGDPGRIKNEKEFN